MATFKLIVGVVPARYVEVPPNSPVRQPGDGFLLVEQPLIDPKTNKQVGRLIARVTWMELPATGDKLHFGNADHCLDHTKKKGVISGSRVMARQRYQASLCHHRRDRRLSQSTWNHHL
jgi:hypothetical protein